MVLDMKMRTLQFLRLVAAVVIHTALVDNSAALPPVDRHIGSLPSGPRPQRVCVARQTIHRGIRLDAGRINDLVQIAYVDVTSSWPLHPVKSKSSLSGLLVLSEIKKGAIVLEEDLATCYWARSFARYPDELEIRRAILRYQPAQLELNAFKKHFGQGSVGVYPHWPEASGQLTVTLRVATPDRVGRVSASCTFLVRIDAEKTPSVEVQKMTALLCE